MAVSGNAGELVGDSAPEVIRPQRNNGPLKMIVLGDSLAKGAGDERGLGIAGSVEAELSRLKIKKGGETVNLAVNGSKTADLVALLASQNVQQLIAESNVVVVSVGGNDLFGSGLGRDAPPANPEKVMAGVQDRVENIVRTIRRVNPSARLFLIGLYNPFIETPYGSIVSRHVNRWNATLVQRFESDPKLTVVQTSDIFIRGDRLSADRFHPGGEAYAIIGRRIAESL
jgi:lysophospholipase L1-like esterase